MKLILDIETANAKNLLRQWRQRPHYVRTMFANAGFFGVENITAAAPSEVLPAIPKTLECGAVMWVVGVGECTLIEKAREGYPRNAHEMRGKSCEMWWVDVKLRADKSVRVVAFIPLD